MEIKIPELLKSLTMAIASKQSMSPQLWEWLNMNHETFYKDVIKYVDLQEGSFTKQEIEEKILDLSRKEEFDFYLLCKPDIPWEYDKLRENQYNRESIYEEFKSIMKEKKLNYFIMKGSVSKRISSALKIINNY